MIFTAILLTFCASGSATRQIAVEPSIAAIVGRVAIGGVEDAVYGVAERGSGGGGFEGLGSISLSIDGEPRTGVCGWAEAGWRVAGYAADWKTGGDVEYTYRLQLQQYQIHRRTAIADGHVMLITDIYWTEQVSVGRRMIGVPIHVKIIISAVESVGSRTVLSGVAHGRADTSVFRCHLLRRIAERRASKTLNRELMGALVRIETTGRGLYAAGELPEIIGTIGSGIGTIGRLRR